MNTFQSSQSAQSFSSANSSVATTSAIATSTVDLDALLASLDTTISDDVTKRENIEDLTNLYDKLFALADDNARYEYMLVWVMKAFRPVELIVMQSDLYEPATLARRTAAAEQLQSILRNTTSETLSESVAVIQKLVSTDYSGRPFQIELFSSAVKANAPVQGKGITSARLMLQAIKYIVLYRKGEKVAVAQDDKGEALFVESLLPIQGDFGVDDKGESTGYYDRNNTSLVARIYKSLTFSSTLKLGADSEDMRSMFTKDATIRTALVANAQRQAGYGYDASMTAPVMNMAVEQYNSRIRVNQLMEQKAADVLFMQQYGNMFTKPAAKPKQQFIEDKQTEALQTPKTPANEQPADEQPAGEENLDTIIRIDGESDEDFNARVLQAQLGN